jgi:hypothetical protein
LDDDSELVAMNEPQHELFELAAESSDHYLIVTFFQAALGNAIERA